MTRTFLGEEIVEKGGGTSESEMGEDHVEFGQEVPGIGS